MASLKMNYYPNTERFKESILAFAGKIQTSDENCRKNKNPGRGAGA
jgi:hypothetical protein